MKIVIFQFFFSHLSTIRSLPVWMRNPDSLKDLFEKKEFHVFSFTKNKFFLVAGIISGNITSIPNIFRLTFTSLLGRVKTKIFVSHFRDNYPLRKYKKNNKSSLLIKFITKSKTCERYVKQSDDFVKIFLLS